MDGSQIKTEESGNNRDKSGYKSWKKKYRKMRIEFDQKMQQGENLHKKEERALATAKKLAVENDRLLDLLIDINNSPQIPQDKRIEISLKQGTGGAKFMLPRDKQQQQQQQKDLALKHLEQLLSDTPHLSYIAAKKAKTGYVFDLAPADGETYPGSFLSADDIDNYMYQVDVSMDADTQLPTLAPRAHPNSQPPSWHAHLKNPTSVTNWLRKHAPKIFLQDGEAQDGDDDGHHPAASGAGGHHNTHSGGRKTRGSRGDRGGTGGSGSGGGRGGRGGKRASLASRAAASSPRDHRGGGGGGEWDASMDEDETPVGRGKRKRDDDPGYRPGGSAGRPVKKKKKSDVDGGSVARKGKKETSTPKRDE